MSDQWYYADGDTARGPLSAGDLVAALAQRPDPRRTLLWRHGFSEWQPAVLVAEIAGRLPPPPKPPPPPPPDPPTLPPQTADSAGMEAPTADGAAKLIGIEGWLALLAVVQLLALVRSL